VRARRFFFELVHEVGEDVGHGGAAGVGQLDAGGEGEVGSGCEVAVENRGEVGDGDGCADTGATTDAGVGACGPDQVDRLCDEGGGRGAPGLLLHDDALFGLGLVGEADQLEAVEEGFGQMARGHKLGRVLRGDQTKARGRLDRAQVRDLDNPFVERRQEDVLDAFGHSVQLVDEQQGTGTHGFHQRTQDEEVGLVAALEHAGWVEVAHELGLGVPTVAVNPYEAPSHPSCDGPRQSGLPHADRSFEERVTTGAQAGVDGPQRTTSAHDAVVGGEGVGVERRGHEHLRGGRRSPLTSGVVVPSHASRYVSGPSPPRRSASMSESRPTSANVKWHHGELTEADRQRLLGGPGCVVWFTGLSGSGKSTVARRVERHLLEAGVRAYVLDGDNLRHGLNGDLGFSAADRQENIRRVGEVARLMQDAGLVVLSAFVSPYAADRDRVRGLVPDGAFLEVFVDTPLEVCEARDPKGLYKKARAGEITNFTGISAPYEAPVQPEIHLKTDGLSIDECAAEVVRGIQARGYAKA